MAPSGGGGDPPTWWPLQSPSTKVLIISVEAPSGWDSKNAKLPTGEIEVVPSKIEVVLGPFAVLPFPINRDRGRARPPAWYAIWTWNPAVKNNINRGAGGSACGRP